MPALPGEALLLNISFVDVHAYFNQPASKPVHHRFDKGSYLYLYYNSTKRRARLEVANSAGTPDQDAFNGYLDHAMLTNTYKHPNLFTVAVDSVRHGGTSPRPADHSHWHLPAFGLTHEHKYLYKIHTLDLYLWTTNDAIKFLDLMKHIMPEHLLDIHEAVPPEHDGSMSPVVQQLESMAVQTPPHARAPSTVSNVSHQSRHGHTPEGQRAVSLQTALASPPASTSQLAPYNPAAPAAPEPIAHREKTPPPADAGNGTGLTAPATHDHPGAYTTAGPQYNNVAPQHGFPGPPQRATSLGSFPPPPPLATQPPHPGLQTAHSFAGPPTSLQSSTTQQQQHHAQTQYASYPQHQSAQYPQSPGFSMHAPMQSPGDPGTPSQPPTYGIHTPLLSPAFAPQHVPQSPRLASTSHGGFSNYTYGPQSSQLTLPTEPFAVHSQAYRPTEQEASAHEHGHGHGSKVQQQQVPPKPGGFEERLKKTEKGVGRFLRKLDQKM
ncbi:hypothetical protein E4T39_03588 [Aureobasidium subglaciale]|nr:hypothetical protein E4T39_03588 [Aureobasidium subglaciale]